MPFKIGPLELVIILVIVLVIFGAGKLPQLFDSIGNSIRSLRDSQDSNEEADKPKPKKKTSKKSDEEKPKDILPNG
jgi:sec-independent protein translocase protein TatA